MNTISLKALMNFIAILSLISIVQAQSQLDMLMSEQPKKIELPSNYNQSQSKNIQLHPFKIKFQFLNQITDTQIPQQPIARLFYITSFFYSLLIKVQDISRNQTKFPIDSDGIGRCFGYEVNQDYIQNGFSTKDQDLIIFTKSQKYYQLQGYKGSACVVQRRPLYGFFKFEQYRLIFFQDNANFHNTVVRLIHSILHIIGFNTNFLVKGQHTLIAEVKNHENDTTFFFTSAFQNKRLQVKEVIAVNYGNLQLPIIKTKKVKQAVRQIFECSQTEQVGAALQTVKDSDGKQYVRFHWHPQIYQDQFMVYTQVGKDQYGYYNAHLQNQQLRLSKLSWAMLQDTGFYQFVNHKLVDNFKPRTFESFYYSYQLIDNKTIPKCQMHKQIYAQNAFENINHCNVYGTSMKNTYWSAAQRTRIQNSNKFQQNKCTKISPSFRCIQILYLRSYFGFYQPYQECTFAECTNASNIRILFNGIWHDVCRRQQAGKSKQFKFRTNYTINCPSDFDAFCGEKTCPNWCQKQGICINGKCYYPQNLFQGQLKMQTLQYGYLTQNTGGIIKVCQGGCIDCYCQDCKNHYSSQRCRVKKKHETDENIYFPICPFAFKICLSFTKRIVPCFENYFFQNDGCYKCDSSCAHCQQTYGSRQMINVCKNCQEGNFPFTSICKSCQIDNCMFCKDKGNCKTCKLNYYLGSLQNKTEICLRCLSTCGICDPTNITNCLGCGQGFFLQKNECQSCIASCKKCVNNLTCLQCHKGFISRQNVCVRPCNLPCYQCVLGKPSKCLSCISYYKYNSQNYSCQANSSSDLGCPLGQYKTYKYGQKKCDKIPIANCLIAKQARQTYFDYDLINFCNLCIKGFFVNQIGICQPCSQGCSYCFQSDICSVCDDGFSNPKNRDGSRNKAKCLRCTQNCLQCPASPDQCQLCSNNYILIGTSCHSINQVNISFVFDVDYKEFIMKNNLQTIKKMIYKLIDQKSKIQINQLVEGSVKIFGVISRIFEGQIQKDCMLSYNLTSKFSKAAAEFQYPLIGASFANKIAQCDNFNPVTSVQIVYIISGFASLLVIILLVIIVILVRKLALKDKIILKFEELQSRPQYQGETEHKIGF